MESKSTNILKVIPGLLFMFLIAAFAYGTKDLGFAQWKGLEAIIKTNWKFGATYLHLNYIVIVLLIGMLIRNTIGIPGWAQDGVKTSRLFIKMGVILLGSLYSLTELAKLGATSIALIATFVFGTILLVMFLAKRANMHPASAACLAAGVGVCGVSAIVATSPAVKARTQDVAYAIATILTFGLVCLFTFPILGKVMGLTPSQFGAWAGTGILNSGQVLAAALAFDPGTVDHPSVSLKVGEVFNLTRVIFLPLVVLALTFLYARSAKTTEGATVASGGLLSKFPLFVVGFVATVALTSAGVFGDTVPASDVLKSFRATYSWFFAIGLTGLGLQISFQEMKKAGGQPLIIGTIAGLVKAVGSLLVVLWLID